MRDFYANVQFQVDDEITNTYGFSGLELDMKILRVI